MPGGTGFRFEPLTRKGLLLGLGPSQLAVVLLSLIVAVALVKAFPGTGGLALAVAAVLVAGLLCRSVGGRTPLQWAGVATEFAARRRSKAMRPPPALVASPGGTQRGPFPARVPIAAGITIDELAAAGDEGPLGVVVDGRAGTVSALFRAQGMSFCLLEQDDKEAKQSAWAGVLEAVANQRATVARLQWCQVARADDSGPVLRHLANEGDPGSPGYGGHLALVEGAGARAWRHETFLVLAVGCVLRRGRVDDRASGALRQEVRALMAQLRSTGVDCDRALDGPGASAAIGSFLVPDLDQAPGAHPWPLAVEEHWADLRADGYYFRTYWVAEWPRSHVGTDFLTNLLVSRARRSFSVVMAPVPPDKAARDAESSRTAQLADAQLRAQGGFLETARQRRQAEAVETREVELAEGRGAFRFSGYVAVSAGQRDELERACAELERAAAAARLLVRPLYGQQREALTWALPLGRGA